jgi:hypothetical protein
MHGGAIAEGHYHVVVCRSTSTIKVNFRLICGVPYGVPFDLFGKPYDTAFKPITVAVLVLFDRCKRNRRHKIQKNEYKISNEFNP